MFNFDYDVLQKVLEELRKNEFNAYFAENTEAAKKMILEMIPPGSTVGVGGSFTVRQMGLVELLKKRGNTVYDHWDKELGAEEIRKTLLCQRTCDVFLCSTNAITRDGQLINLDGSGNRVSSMIFGPGKVIVVAGLNKLVDDVQSGIHRVKNKVAPELYARKKAPAPCAAAGYCVNCRPPAKQCRALVIIEARPRMNADFNILLVGEELGI